MSVPDSALVRKLTPYLPLGEVELAVIGPVFLKEALDDTGQLAVIAVATVRNLPSIKPGGAQGDR